MAASNQQPSERNEGGGMQPEQQWKEPPDPALTPGSPEFLHRRRVRAIEKDCVRVRFLIGQPPYNAGETAGLPRDVAERVVNASINTPHGKRKVAELADRPHVLMPRDPNEAVE